jgi:hypothetical protein
MIMTSETAAAGAQATLRKIAVLVQDQRSCLGRLEHSSAEQTIGHLAELRASLWNAGVTHAPARAVIGDILTVLDTHLTLFQSFRAAHERRIMSVGVPALRRADDRGSRRGRRHANGAQPILRESRR